MEEEKTPLRGKLLKSSSCGQLYICPGNAGTSFIGKNINISLDNFDEIKTFVLSKNIDMVIVGPEDPLVNGIYDFFKQDDLLKKISVIGRQKGAQLEEAKNLRKSLCFVILFQQQNTNHLIKVICQMVLTF